MTTIAVKDGIMAADTQANLYGIRSTYNKILGIGEDKDFPKELVGFTGTLPDVGTLVDWYASGQKEPPKFVLYGQETPDVSLLVLHETGIKLVSRWGCITEIELPFFAIGSGSDAAMGAMYMGADAVEAVGIAHRVDIGTGSKVEAREL